MAPFRYPAADAAAMLLAAGTVPTPTPVETRGAVTGTATRMPQETREDRPEEVPGDGGRWVPIREAARLLGRDPKAVRARIERGTLRWRPAGNHGREVYVTPDMEAPAEDGPGEDPGEAAETVSLMVQVARLEERLAAVAAREGDLRALAAELRTRAERAEAELAEARRPWIARLLAGLRRP